MSDLSAKQNPADATGSEPTGSGRWAGLRKLIGRVQDWFSIQSAAMRLLVITVAILIPATASYSFVLWQRQAAVAEQVQAMAGATGSDSLWVLNEKLPVVFGTGSVLGFLENNPVDHITVVYKPLMWNVSERILLIESQGKQFAYYPSDMETRIFSDKAVTAPWGSKLVFIPRGELTASGAAMLERLDERFAGARPQSEKDGWKAGVSGALSAALTLGLLGFLAFHLKGQFKSLRFIEPGQVQGSIKDLVGMDDIKAEVRQIKDQYERRAEYAEYGIHKPFNVMFSGPAGTGKTKLASYLAKELNLPILFHSAVNLETGFVGGGANTLGRIVAMAKRRKRCIVFLDEAQDLFMKRGGNRKFDDDTQNMLLAILDGVRTKSEAEIIWIVASNFNSESMTMDEAMLRRFQMKVDFRLPNKEERRAIVEHYLEQRSDKVADGLDLRHLVEITEGRSPADLETIINQAGITAVQAGDLIATATLMQAAERVMVGNVNTNTTKERDRDRRIIAIHEWGHFLVDFELERKAAGGDWEQLQAEMKTIKISLKANPRNNALGFVFHKQGANLLKTKSDIEHEVRVLLGGMANEELFFGEEGTTNGAHNDITRVTKLLHHAVAEMGMYRKTRLNFGALGDGHGARTVDDETRAIMELQSERLYGETRALLAGLKPLTEHLAGKLMQAGEMSLKDALFEIRSFEAACFSFDARVGLGGTTLSPTAPDAA
ncbi:MAG: AAA-metalloprotease-like protein [Ramlibacter sp.]|jgi:cell division protease FtsH|uniref:AAA family ATPase n=1 Tax=Ramlibacter sp. TaxID=1917967 RepID=UPI00260DF03C|nr:AAA family ATPase [Ramlibacter sp.]MDB5750062.1 AAA-metalloprotease-like protein [Ramlibacter sp.]